MHITNLVQKALIRHSKKGLKKTSRGALGQDESVIKTDQLLDNCRPAWLRKAGVSRDNNVYAFIGDEEHIVDIRDGRTLELEKYKLENGRSLLQLTINPEYCYVSDLGLFDSIKENINTLSSEELHKRTTAYWQALTPRTNFVAGTIKRPKAMITDDIQPSQIKLLRSN